MSDPATRKEEDDAPLTGSASDAADPMRLRGEAPRVTRLSRKVLAGIGLVASVGIGGALIYALQTRDSGKSAEELCRIATRLQQRPAAWSAAPGGSRATHPGRAESWPAVAEPAQSWP